MGKILIRKTATGYDFSMVAANGETIATSQVYKAKPSCRKGIHSMQVNAPIAGLEDQTVKGAKVLSNPKFELYTDKGGASRFHLKARNGQIIAVSQAYKEKAGALKGIESIRKNAPEAKIEEVKE